MNAHNFLTTYGWEEAERVAISAGTTRSYFSQLAHGHRRASVELAQRLAAASDNRMTVIKLLTDETKSSVPPAAAAAN